MTPTHSARALGYGRVSTSEQADSGAGLAAQKATIIEACRARDLHLVDLIEDAGWSAKTLARPGMAEALSRLDRRDADVLVVAKLDRLSRSLADFASVLDRARKRGWQLVAVDLGVDTTTPAGELVASVMAAVAQWERRAIGVRTSEAMAQRKAAGIHVGRPSGLGTVVRDRIVVERQAGKTLSNIADGLNRDGVPTGQGGLRWYASTVRSVIAR